MGYQKRSSGGVAEIRSVVVHPRTSTRVCAASSDPVRIFCSDDGGSSWSAAEQGLPLRVMEVVGSPRLAFDQAPPHRMFLAIAFRADGTFAETRLFVLADDGHWIPILADLPVGLGLQALNIDATRRYVQVWWSRSLAEVPLRLDVGGEK